MNRQHFNDWLKTHNACAAAVEWCDQHPKMSVQDLIDLCPRGDWILWVYAKEGYARDVMAPVAYRAATRAMGYAADAFDRVGVQHGLRGLVIHDVESARDAEGAAWAAGAAAWAAAGAAAGASAGAALAAEAAEWAARAAGAAGTAERAAEHKLCADDCRQLLPELRIEV